MALVSSGLGSVEQNCKRPAAIFEPRAGRAFNNVSTKALRPEVYPASASARGASPLRTSLSLLYPETTSGQGKQNKTKQKPSAHRLSAREKGPPLAPHLFPCIWTRDGRSRAGEAKLPSTNRDLIKVIQKQWKYVIENNVTPATQILIWSQGNDLKTRCHPFSDESERLSLRVLLSNSHHNG